MASPLKELSFGSVNIYSDEILGVGSYGRVCKAKCGQLPCAAKLLHDNMFLYNDPGISKFVERFQRECQFLKMIKHPNIVQYLGTSTDPQSHRPILLMELMDKSLTEFLEQHTGPIPYHTQLNICHDVALALAYLHSNNIIHRDLSSNNILLIGEGSRAKVADFGMCKLLIYKDLKPGIRMLTEVPGASVYMPPEALISPSDYSNKLDCFSYGVLTIQIATKEYPDPGAAFRKVKDSNYPNEVLLKIPEIERRKEIINQINPKHPLLSISLQCLKDEEAERPPANQLCISLSTLKSEREYAHSVEEAKKTINSMQDQCLCELRTKAEEYRRQLDAKESALNAKESEVEQLHERIAYLKIDHDQCLNELRSKTESEVEQLRKRIVFLKKDQTKKVLPLQNPPVKKKPPPVKPSIVPVKLSWTAGKPAPETMSSYWGVAMVHGNTAYFSQQHTVYSYAVLEDKWTKLQPPCRYKWFGMAVIKGLLTTIGGWDDDEDTAISTLLRLSAISEGSWNELLPQMPTKRLLPAAVSTPTHLVVAGGMTTVLTLSRDALSEVEIFELETLQWSSASPSPQPLQYPRMTLCDGYLYLSEHETMFSCSLEEFFKSTYDGNSVWTKLADIPTTSWASLATLRGHVLAIGGSEVIVGNPTQDIHCYDKRTNSWIPLKEMPTPRSDTLVAVLSNGEMVVVGGREKKEGRHSISESGVTEIAHADV